METLIIKPKDKADLNFFLNLPKGSEQRQQPLRVTLTNAFFKPWRIIKKRLR